MPPPASKPDSSILRPSREAAEKVPTVATCRQSTHEQDCMSRIAYEVGFSHPAFTWHFGIPWQICSTRRVVSVFVCEA